jgi:hypothetical protein
MANLTDVRNTKRLAMEPSARHNSVVNDDATIFHGGMVGFDATTGLLKRGGGVAAGFTGALVGRACGSISGTHSGESMDFETGVFEWDLSGLDESDLNTVVYAADDQTVNATNTNVPAGILVKIEGGKAYVLMGFQIV